MIEERVEVAVGGGLLARPCGQVRQLLSGVAAGVYTRITVAHRALHEERFSAVELVQAYAVCGVSK